MPPTSLEELPAELITAILYTLASPTALLSLIQASARCYKIFLLYKDDILLTTLRDGLRPEFRSLVLLVHESYHLPAFDGGFSAQRRFRVELDKFMEKFSRDHELDEQESHLPTPSFVAPQLRTICTMEYFVEDYCNWVSDHLHSTKVHSAASGPCKGMLPSSRAHQDLSHVERSRLQRSFLRYEIFCTGMYCAGAREPSMGINQVPRMTNNRFLNVLQPWEREEWVCILDYLTAKVEAVFDRLELDYVERMTDRFLNGEMDHKMSPVDECSSTESETDASDRKVSNPSLAGALSPNLETKDGQPETQVDHSVRFFTTTTKQNLHARYVKHLITLGLPFLRRLFQSRIKDQREIVLANLKVDGDLSNLVGQKWINREQLSLLRRQGADPPTYINRHGRLVNAIAAANTPTTAVAAAATAAAAPPALAGLAIPGNMPADPPRDFERALTFEGDHVGKPNLAFLWTHGFTGTNVCNRSCDHVHRALGYVFWDQRRLEEMGLVQKNHWWRWKELKMARERWREKSAQERLAEMGFVLPDDKKLVLVGLQEKGDDGGGGGGGGGGGF